MSQVVSVRLKDEQLEHLKRFARRWGKSQSEMGAQFIEEKMRESEFAFIEFRDSSIGRQVFMKGSRLPVWWVIRVARDHDMNVEAVAHYFRRPREWVNAALHYYEAYPKEIEQAMEDGYVSIEEMKRRLPNINLVEIPKETVEQEPAA